MGLLDPNSNIPNASGVWGWNGTERLQPGAKYTSAGGEETKAPVGPEAFSTNSQGEFYDPTFKRWMPSQGQNAWNMDFRKQVAANLANGNSAAWSSQTGWDQRSPIPAAWGSQPSAPPTQNRDYRMEGNGMPSSIVGLSGVTRKIDYAGRVLGDDGQPMSDANGLLSYRRDGLYSGDKLAYGIQDGRVTQLPQQGQPSAIPPSQGMAPSAQQQMPYQWNTPQTTKQAAFNPMMNNFFSRYWGK